MLAQPSPAAMPLTFLVCTNLASNQAKMPQDMSLDRSLHAVCLPALDCVCL